MQIPDRGSIANLGDVKPMDIGQPHTLPTGTSPGLPMYKGTSQAPMQDEDD